MNASSTRAARGSDWVHQGLASAYTKAKREKRQESRARIHNRVVHPIDTPHLIPDPLARQLSTLGSTLNLGRLLVAALFVHALILLVLSMVSQMMGQHAVVKPTKRVEVQIREIVKPPPPPPPEEKKEVVNRPVQPDFVPKKPKATPPPKPKPRRAKRKKKIKPPPVVKPPPPKPEAPPVRRRIVGLNLESTVQGGGGPAFAIGTSRMGETAKKAVAPKKASVEPTDTDEEGSGEREQRAAAHIPTRDVVFVKPKRVKASKPPYPETLRAQGLEGEVLVRVRLSAAGRATKVKVLRSSGHAAFDAAARKAAFAEVFSPARRDGKPVPYTLTYHYYFRIEED